MAGIGTIERISFSEEDRTSARLSIRYGPRPKPGKGDIPTSYHETSDLVVPAALARKLRIGQRVRITVEPLGAAGKKVRPHR